MGRPILRHPTPKVILPSLCDKRGGMFILSLPRRVGRDIPHPATLAPMTHNTPSKHAYVAGDSRPYRDGAMRVSWASYKNPAC
jgi:hypothetical protein